MVDNLDKYFLESKSGLKARTLNLTLQNTIEMKLKHALEKNKKERKGEREKRSPCKITLTLKYSTPK